MRAIDTAAAMLL